MAPITESVEIARPPEDVFAYATDFSLFPEWQGSVSSVRPEGDEPATVGSRAAITRRVGPRQLAASEEITELTAPSTWSVRAVDRLVTATARALLSRLKMADGRG